MGAAITISDIKTAGGTLHAQLAGVVTTYADIAVTLQAADDSLPDGTYKLELYNGTTLLASTEQAGSTSISVSGGEGSGVLSTRTTAAQNAVANDEAIDATLVLQDDAANYMPARLGVRLRRNEAGEAAVDLVDVGTTVPDPSDATDGSVMQALSGAWSIVTRASWLGTILAAIRGLSSFGAAGQVIKVNSGGDGLEWADDDSTAGAGLETGDIDTLAELNAIVSDATLDDSGDPRAPTEHASNHVDGTDDIQSATAAQKGLATAAQITKLDGIEAGATADQSDAEIETAYNNQVPVASQAEMEAGTETAIRRMSPERVKQAIDALAAGGLSESDIDTLAELNAIVGDATLDDASAERPPSAHASEHTDGTDDIQLATTMQKGLMSQSYASKLEGIEQGATDDQTPQEILSAVESESGRDMSADGTKLDGIESGATGDLSDSEIETAYNNQVAAASQVEMEAGTEAAIRRMSPLRVAQAIAALASIAWTELTGTLTLSQLNSAVSDATLDDSSAERPPSAHASDHTDGTDDIQDATAAQKGLATATQITKLDGIEASADVTDATNVDAAGATMNADNLSEVANAATAFANIKQAASESATGVVELATAAETTTGTDTGRAVTPDGLAGSDYGKRVVQLTCVERATDNATGSVADLYIPSALNGWNLVSARADVQTAGTTGTQDVSIYNVTDSVDMLSTDISIASAGTGDAGVVDGTNDDVATDDHIRIDVDAVHTTPAKGLVVTLVFQAP